MEADVSNCARCDVAGGTTPLKSYYLNLEEIIQCCPHHQCTYHLQNATLTHQPVAERDKSSSSIQPVDPVRHRVAQSILQWRNQDSFCWLDASMSLLVTSTSLRECISKAKKDCILKRLFVDYDKAMGVYQGGLNINDNESLSLDGTGHRQNLISKPTTDDDSLFAMCQDLTPVNLDRSDPHVKLKEAVDILNEIRNMLFVELQPMLKCERGSKQSPLFALLALLDRSNPFTEHFIARYHVELHCALCGHIQVTCFQKGCISFIEVSGEFDVGQPVILMKCPECKASQQQGRLVYHKLSQCVMMQFVNGLPHNKLDLLQMYVDGDEYKLAAVIQYKQSPEHFVAWIRDVHENLWIECDDLKPSECKWTNAVPDIPANQIHMIVLERQNKRCISCFKQADYINSLVHSTVSVEATKRACEKRQPAVPHPASCKRSGDLSNSAHQPVLKVPNRNFKDPSRSVPPVVTNTQNTLGKNKFMGFQESKRKNVENSNRTNSQMNYIDGTQPSSKRIAINNVLLDNYLKTCVKGEVLSNTAKPVCGKRRTKLFNKVKPKQNDDTLSVVMAAIPDRLLSQVCTKNTRKVCKRSEGIGIASVNGSSHIRRRAGQFNQRQNAKYPSYGQNVFDGFTKNARTKKPNIDITVPSPNPSVTSDLSSSSELSATSDGQLQAGIETPSECSLDSSGLDSQGGACQNISLDSSLDDPNLTFEESAFLDANQDEFLSSLLETDFVTVPFI